MIWDSSIRVNIPQFCDDLILLWKAITLNLCHCVLFAGVRSMSPSIVHSMSPVMSVPTLRPVAVCFRHVASKNYRLKTFRRTQKRVINRHWNILIILCQSFCTVVDFPKCVLHQRRMACSSNPLFMGRGAMPTTPAWSSERWYRLWHRLMWMRSQVHLSQSNQGKHRTPWIISLFPSSQ